MSASDSPPVLVLWDIDHTLIDLGGLSFDLYRRAFRLAMDRELRPVNLSSGRTDLDVMHQTLRANGIEPTVATRSTLASALIETYRCAQEELRSKGRVLPGAVESLERLSRERRVHQGVLTGNLRSVAAAKLAAYRLDGFLDLESSAYGDDHLERADLVPVAIRAAQARTGISHEPADTVLIGDTPNDIAAAAAAGARVIAVATGRTSAADLRESGAGNVLDDLTDTEQVARLTLS